MAIKDQAEKQKRNIGNQLLDAGDKSITSLFSKDFLTEEAIHELNKIKEIVEILNGNNLIYKMGDKTYDFQKFKTIRLFRREIYNDELPLAGAIKEKNFFLNDIDKFNLT